MPDDVRLILKKWENSLIYCQRSTMDNILSKKQTLLKYHQHTTVSLLLNESRFCWEISQSVSSSVIHMHGIILMNTSHHLTAPFPSSFSHSSLPPSLSPLFSGQWKCACVQILSAVCNFWLWWRASAQPQASGFAAQPQSRHMKNCWVQAGLFLPVFVCVLVCIWTLNERWFILQFCLSVPFSPSGCSLYILPLVHLTICPCVSDMW